MALFKPVRLLDSQLKSFPIKNGQILFTLDAQNYYIDISDTKRIQITDIIRLTEKERIDIVAPITHFYYTIDKKQLWEYNGVWTLLNSVLSHESICEIIGYEPAQKEKLDILENIINELKYGIDLDGGYPTTSEDIYRDDYDGGYP